MNTVHIRILYYNILCIYIMYNTHIFLSFFLIYAYNMRVVRRVYAFIARFIDVSLCIKIYKV